MTNSKLVKLGKKGQFVIPKVLRDAIGIKEGELLLINAENDRLVIIPAGKYASLTRGLLKGIWGETKEEIEAYLKKERDAWG
jgi:AbrB family looped-hinge helix DNA binding protein